MKRFHISIWLFFVAVVFVLIGLAFRCFGQSLTFGFGDLASRTSYSTGVEEFAPDSIVTLVVWYQSDGPTGYADGEELTNWVDAGPYSAFATNVTASAPFYREKYLNGLPAVDFNYSAFLNASAATPMSSNQSVFVLAELRTRAASMAYLSDMPLFNGVYVDSTPTLRAAVNGSAAAYGTLTYETPLLISWIRDGTNSFAYTNGTLVAQGQVNPDDTFDNVRTLGAINETGTWPLDGLIYEVIAYNETLSTGDRQAVEGWLQNKWFLTNQPPIGGTVLWALADDIAEADGTSNVDDWPDRSPAGNHLIDDAGRQPGFTNHIDEINGHAAVSFAEVDGMYGAIGQTFSQPICIFVVCRFFTFGTDPIVGSTNLTTDYTLVARVNSTSNLIAVADATSISDSSMTPLNTWRLLSFKFDGASSFIRTNGVQAASGTVGDDQMNGIGIGGNENDWYLNGQVAAVIVSTNDLDSTDFINTENFLSNIFQFYVW